MRYLLIKEETVGQLLSNKRLREGFKSLLLFINMNTDTDNKFIDNYFCCDSYECLAKCIGYKTRSGCFKLIKRLEQLGIITLLPCNVGGFWIRLNGRMDV